MQQGGWFGKIGIILSGVLLGLALAEAQPAQGTLRVTAVVQTSVTLMNTDGQWRLVVANARDPADNVSSLMLASTKTFQAYGQTANGASGSQQPSASAHPTSNIAVRINITHITGECMQTLSALLLSNDTAGNPGEQSSS